MCVHLDRVSLKEFLVREAESEEGVERAEDSILGKWTQIAKKTQTWLDDASTKLLPSLLDQCLSTPLKSPEQPSAKQLSDLGALVELLTVILEEKTCHGGEMQGKVLRLLLRDRHVECLLEFFARKKISDREEKLAFT